MADIGGDSQIKIKIILKFFYQYFTIVKILSTVEENVF
jgi:hypothetical protein